MGTDLNKLEEQIQKLPKEGQGGKRDLLPFYADGEAMDVAIKYLAEPFRDKVDFVCSPEPLGFIVGSMLARELGVGLVVIRRNRQFWIDPEEHLTASYINHCDQVTTLVTERKLLPESSRVLLADDWMSTAATMQACATVIEEAGCKLAGVAAVGVDYRPGVRDMIDSGKVRYIYCEK